MLGESEPSAPSRPYVVSGYSGRVYERPVAGPYITFTDAVNETAIMLKWMVSGWATRTVEMFLLPLVCEFGFPLSEPDSPFGVSWAGDGGWSYCWLFSFKLVPTS